jgi:hypothetical protein
MLKMRPCSARGRQIGSDQDWKSSKLLKYSEKKVTFYTNLEQLFNGMATDLDMQPTTSQHRLTCALKNARFLPDGFCCFNDKENEILFRINISPPHTKIAGLDWADQYLGLPGHRT